MQEITLQLKISGKPLSLERISEELEMMALKILTGETSGFVTSVQGEPIGEWSFKAEEAS